jgi:hypothetical protein
MAHFLLQSSIHFKVTLALAKNRLVLYILEFYHLKVFWNIMGLENFTDLLTHLWVSFQVFGRHRVLRHRWSVGESVRSVAAHAYFKGIRHVWLQKCFKALFKFHFWRNSTFVVLFFNLCGLWSCQFVSKLTQIHLERYSLFLQRGWHRISWKSNWSHGQLIL